jgi:hypothetical protein
LEFELGAWFEGACGFALVLALSQMMEHRLGTFGRADLHPRRNPIDRQDRFAPQPGSDGQLAGVAAPAGGQLELLPAPPPWLEGFLVEGLQPAPFHLPHELLTPRCGVLPNAVLGPASGPRAWRAARTQPRPATTRQSNTENRQSASAPSVRPIHPDQSTVTHFLGHLPRCSKGQTQRKPLV